MSLLLCHDCYSWVEPYDGRCPECLQLMDVTTPDPPLDWLERAIGDVRSGIGPVRILRSFLPDCGMLYETTNGLYFVPHQLEYVTQQVKTSAAGSSVLWTVAALLWTPLTLVLPFVRAERYQEKQIPVLKPMFLSPDDTPTLALLLMQNPGVLFIPRQSIHVIRRKRQQWLIQRREGSVIKIKPERKSHPISRSMQRLAESRHWQDVLFE